MMRILRFLSASGPCLLLLLSAAFGQSPGHHSEALAPRDCWMLRGGNPARTGHADTPATFGDLEPAWEFSSGEAIEGEPLVWRDAVIVAVRDKETQRSLHVLHLLDGRPRVKPRRFTTKRPLEPVIAGDLVVVRSKPERIQGFRIGKTILDPRWSFDAKEAVGAPVVAGKELFVPTQNSLCRLTLGRRKPDWRMSGRYRGDLAVRDGHVYTLRYGKEGNARLVALSRDRGEIAAGADAGHHQGSVPDVWQPLVIAAYEDGIVAHHAFPVSTIEGRRNNAAIIVRRKLRKSGRLRLVTSGLIESPATGVPSKRAWIGPVTESSSAELVQFRFEPRGLSTLGLTAAGRHRDFADGRVPLMRAKNVVFCGSRCFNLIDNKILWDSELVTLKRPIPARDTLLLSPRADTITAMRAPRSGTSTAGKPALPPAAAQASRGLAVLGDGSVVAGDLSLDPTSGELEAKASRKNRKKRRSWPLETVVCLVDAKRRLVFAPDGGAALAGLTRLAEDARSRHLADLAARACEGGDVAQIAALLDRARDAGVDEGLVKNSVRRMEYLRKRPRPVKAAIRDEVAAAAKTADAAGARFLWQALQKLSAERKKALEVPLLRALLASDPAHEAAGKRIRSWLPEGLPGRDDLPPTQWLDFVEATRQTPIQFVPPPRLDMENPTRNQRELGSALYTWRKDLVGVQSQNLLILTPLASPGQVARCLSMGEVVCETLEGMFTGLGTPRRVRDPLILNLFETKEEYEKEATKKYGPAAKRARAALHYTAGHYDPQKEVTRIFLPEQAGAFDAVRNTYAHEITHHWLDTRAPRFGASRRKRNVGTPCYFLVEGFATLIEEGRFDVAARSYASFDPRCASLDVIGNAKKGQLLPWKLLLTINQVQFNALPPEPDKRLVVPMRWRLGMARQSSLRRMFYDQGAAVCQYLYHADDGRYRAKLLELVARHYAGATPKNAVAEIIGLSPDALGAAVRAYARKIAGS